MGEKAKLDDKDKAAQVDVGPDRATPPKQSADEEDKLGSSANANSAVGRSLRVVENSFIWFNDAAQQRLDTLRRDLKREDEPDWIAQAAEGLLELALGEGAARAAKYITGKLVAKGSANAGLVENLFTAGIGAGVNAGRGKLSSGKNDHVIDPFVDAQKDGVRAAQMENQTQFIKTGQDNIHTLEEAEALEAACSKTHAEQAAKEQYNATRDAWVSYLAQAKFGARGRNGPVTKDSVNVGPTTTNMSTQESRDRTNRGAPDFVPGDAPSLEASMHGHAPGILEVYATLPPITVFDEMRGKPKVELAMLNGVNDTIRKQYANVPLGEMNIPRQITANVQGPYADFTLNLDEKGSTNALKPSQSAWLKARATVGHPENADKNDMEKEREGLRLLLAELVPPEVKKAMF